MGYWLRAIRAGGIIVKYRGFRLSVAQAIHKYAEESSNNE